MIRFRFGRMAVTAAGLGLIVGCGDDTGLDKRYPVSGTVTAIGRLVCSAFSIPADTATAAPSWPEPVAEARKAWVFSFQAMAAA